MQIPVGTSCGIWKQQDWTHRVGRSTERSGAHNWRDVNKDSCAQSYLLYAKWGQENRRTSVARLRLFCFVVYEELIREFNIKASGGGGGNICLQLSNRAPARPQFLSSVKSVTSTTRFPYLGHNHNIRRNKDNRETETDVTKGEGRE